MANKTPVDFDLKALLDLVKLDTMISTNCHGLGTIQSFNSLKQTVQVTMDYKRTINNKLVDYPVLIDCPLIISGGGLVTLTFPVTTGDKCLILFNDRDIDNWFLGGVGAPPASDRIHSFSDALALIGPRNLTKLITSYDSLRGVLKYGPAGPAVAVSATKAVLEFSMAGPSVEASATKASLLGATAKVEAGAVQVNIANAITTLGTILTQLITALSSATTIPAVPGTPLPFDPSVIAQLTAIQVLITGLLQ